MASVTAPAPELLAEPAVLDGLELDDVDARGGEAELLLDQAAADHERRSVLALGAVRDGDGERLGVDLEADDEAGALGRRDVEAGAERVVGGLGPALVEVAGA